jgi:hypothetical protein
VPSICKNASSLTANFVDLPQDATLAKVPDGADQPPPNVPTPPAGEAGRREVGGAVVVVAGMGLLLGMFL